MFEYQRHGHLTDRRRSLALRIFVAGVQACRTARVLRPAGSFALWLAIFVPTIFAVAPSAQADETLEYNSDIRPILAENCFACHGPDSASRKADLRLDRREDAIEMGAIVEGDPDSSEMIRRMMSDDPAEMMPPPESKKTLTDQQKERLAEWVRTGAEYQLHWSFIAPQRPSCRRLRTPSGFVIRSISSFWPSSKRPDLSRPKRPTAARWLDGWASI